MPRKVPDTKEDFVNKARRVHGNKYDYDLVVYVNSTTHVDIICPEHGVFRQVPSSHLYGRNCPKCSKSAKWTEKDFLRVAREVHGDTYSYDSAVFSSIKSKVDITCKVHGVFSQTAESHINGHGCKKCASEAAGLLRRITLDEFIADSNEIHDGKYDYSLISEYSVGSDEVDVVCKDHGVFRVKAFSHRHGTGCPWCPTKGGFKSHKKGSIYVLKCGDITKVGITNYKVSTRAKQISQSYGKKFDVITYMTFSHGAIPHKVESQILRELKLQYEQPSEKFDGSTECFFNVCIPSLIKRIGTLASEQFN